MAANLPGHRDLMVISNNLNVVDMLDGRDSIDVVVVGGKVRRGDRAVVGPLAMSFIDAFKVDVAAPRRSIPMAACSISPRTRCR